MGISVLIYGKSGTGKSTSLFEFRDNVGIINVTGKPLPFRNPPKQMVSDDYDKISNKIKTSKVDSFVIDDAGYLITNQFMRGHSKFGSGNAIFQFYNEIADKFWGLFQLISTLPENKIVYVVMHEEKTDSGDIQLKTIGKMLNEKVCIEGLTTIALRSACLDGKYVFYTQTNGLDVCKSPMGMFEERIIPNNLRLIDEAIRNYYWPDERRTEENESNL